MYNNYYQPTQTPSYLQQPQPNLAARQTLNLKGRPVTSIDEARASSIDFDGTVFYFPDLANKKIYTKQINLDGTSTLLMYELKEIPVSQDPSFVTREEFDSTINQLKSLLVPIVQSNQESAATAQTVSNPVQETPKAPPAEFKF